MQQKLTEGKNGELRQAHIKSKFTCMLIQLTTISLNEAEWVTVKFSDIH